jgi:hypothetical protein
MTIFIAPIGTHPDFVKTWLKEESRNLAKLWLIHSPVGMDDFPKKAKKLSSELKKSYPDLKIELKVMNDAFTIDPVMDAITEIINQEEDNDPMLLREEIVINITGGTNVVAAGAMNSANRYQTKCHYVLMKQDGDPKNKRLVREVPISAKPKSDLKDSQLKVLKTINKSEYFIPNTPAGLEPKITIGSIANNSLLEQLGWDKKQKGTKNGRTRLGEILKVLEKNKLVEKIDYTELYQLPKGAKLPFDAEIDNSSKKRRVKVTVNGESDFYPWPLSIVKNNRETRWIITPEGRRESKNQFLKLE